jgi:ubiquinol-cytochrome c reductase iron-sulfur subunit
MSHDTLDTSRYDFDVDDPRMNRFDLVREGARRDGVEIVHYAPRFPVRGTHAERRIERTIALMFMLVGLFGTIFVVAYIWWPWTYGIGSAVTGSNRVLSKLYTPILGLSLGLALLFLGLAIITWGKKLLPEEVSVQERHNGPSPRDEQRLTSATILNMGDELGVRRRPMLIGALALGSLPLAAAAAAPIVGALIKSPHKSNDGKRNEAVFFTTGFNAALYNGGKPVYLCRMDGSKVRPEEVSIGGQITVFPLIFNEAHEFVGATNEFADSPTLLIHLRNQDAETARKNAKPINVGSQWGNLVAYTKICSHAGCPASLYEQQTNRLLCPCHQSQFQITDNARPVFGPASRALAQLPIDVDADGYLFAKSDYKVPVGPGFWERP